MLGTHISFIDTLLGVISIGFTIEIVLFYTGPPNIIALYIFCEIVPAYTLAIPVKVRAMPPLMVFGV